MPNELSHTTKRLLSNAIKTHQASPEKAEVSYQHKVLAQTCLPYRNPKGLEKWERYNGDTAMLIRSLEVLNPREKKSVIPGLPYGPKARILMIYLNQQAIMNDSPLIDVEDNMTAFLKRVHGSSLNGREIKAYKEQMTRLASCHFSFAISISDEQTIQDAAGKIVGAFDLWFPKDENQRVLWSSKIELSPEYFQTLKRYLVPLNENSVRALSHSAMGLDIYTWLAQRLHRIPEDETHFIGWKNLKDQFGHGYGRMDNFKRVFRDTLQTVLTQYPEANRGSVIEDRNKGYHLKQAAPPVPYRKKAVKEIEG